MDEVTKLSFKKHKVFSEKKPENEIFISRKRKNPDKFYSDRAFQLFNKLNYKEVYMCGLGACVSLAVSASLNLMDITNDLKIEDITTSTVKHVDDYIDIDNQVFIKLCL